MANRIGLGVFMTLAVAAAGATGYFAYEETQSTTFLEGSVLNGTDVSGMTPAEAEETLVTGFDGSQITLREDGRIVLAGSLADYGYQFDSETVTRELTEKMEAEKRTPKDIACSLLNKGAALLEMNRRFEIPLTQDLPHTFDENTLKEKVNAASLYKERTVSEDAYITFDKEEGRNVIVPEIVGDEFEDSALQEYVRAQLDALIEGGEMQEDRYILSMDFPEELYIDPPEVKAEDQDLQDRCTALNTFIGSKVTYVFGSEKLVLDYDRIMEMVDIDGPKATLNEKKLKAFVHSLGEKYDTRYHERIFRTTYGTNVTINAGLNEYGYEVLEDQEYAQLKKDIESGKPVEREPIYLRTNSWGNPYFYSRNGVDDINGTYVECNLSAQHLWFYKNGKLICESDFVSGDISKKRGTQTGCFPLAYKESPSILRGGEGAGAYETPVSFWMPFYEGQGLHDATWRGSFGGGIYKYDGSHGCINLPYWAAETIYNNISPGVPIVIYY